MTFRSEFDDQGAIGIVIRTLGGSLVDVVRLKEAAPAVVAVVARQRPVVDLARTVLAGAGPRTDISPCAARLAARPGV